MMRPYDQLIGAALNGERYLSARRGTVEAAWRIVQPVFGGVVPAIPYARASWGPAEADAFVPAGGTWHDFRAEPVQRDAGLTADSSALGVAARLGRRARAVGAFIDQSMAALEQALPGSIVSFNRLNLASTSSSPRRSKRRTSTAVTRTANDRGTRQLTTA